MNNWQIYTGSGEPHDGIRRLPAPPGWRHFDGKIQETRRPSADPHLERRFGRLDRGETYQASEKEIDLVNTALYLRRPLLVTGKPGVGKSSLAYAVAHELKLGKVLRWSITSSATLRDALYRYDAIGRLQEAKLARKAPDIGQFLRLGPLGTALLPAEYPRVLLIDEIDKSNIDLPNDLLNIFEEGEFEIPELSRLSEKQEMIKVLPHDGNDKVTVLRGQVRCAAFPFVVITSNGERELPPPLLRRCLRLDIDEPNPEKLARIVASHFNDSEASAAETYHDLIQAFLKKREKGDLATDQLLNAIYLTTQGIDLTAGNTDKEALLEAVLRYLSLSGIE